MIGLLANVLIGVVLVGLVVRRGTRPRRRTTILLVAVALFGTTIAQAEHYARRTATDRAQDVVQGCASVDGTEIDLGNFPVVIGALRGRLDDVQFRADALEVGDLRMHDLDVEVARVRLRALGSLEDVDIERAEGSVRVGQGALNRLLAGLGLSATTTVTRDGILLRLPPAIDIELAITVKDGSAFVTLPELPGLQSGVELAIPGVTIESIDAKAGVLEVRVTASGRPRDLVCRAAAALEQGLQPLALVSGLPVVKPPGKEQPAG